MIQNTKWKTTGRSHDGNPKTIYRMYVYVSTLAASAYFSIALINLICPKKSTSGGQNSWHRYVFADIRSGSVEPEPQQCDNESAYNVLPEVEYEFTLQQASAKIRGTRRSHLWRYAKPMMTMKERRTMRQLMVEFAGVCESNNFTYFIISGTLLGSFQTSQRPALGR